jgi:hypothetical protein
VELADMSAHYFVVAVFFSKKKQYKNGIVSGSFPDRTDGSHGTANLRRPDKLKNVE